VPVAAAGSCNLLIRRQFFSLESRFFALKQAVYPPLWHLVWRAQRMEGTTLSSTGTVENNPQPDEAQAPHDGHDHDLAHDHEGHDHEGHDHEGHDHQHGPVLNPDCTRELVLDIPAEEVSAAYRTVTGNYKKYAKIPAMPTASART
jgi:hypothetical protein